MLNMNYTELEEQTPGGSLHLMFIGPQRSAELEYHGRGLSQVTLYHNSGKVETKGTISQASYGRNIMHNWCVFGSVHDELSAHTDLPFPFVRVDALQAALGVVPNWPEAVKAIPPEFRSNSNAWSQAAETIFSRGAKRSAFTFQPSVTDHDAMLRYFKAWLGSFDTRHEDKVAGGGWLLSLMLTEVPKGL